MWGRTFFMLNLVQASILIACLSPEDPKGFSKWKSNRNRRNWVRNNPDLSQAQKKRFAEMNPGKLESYQKKYNDSVREYRRESQFKSRYGISRSRRKTMIEEQDGRCKICYGSLVRNYIDHCHKSGKIRGVRCPKCNCGIGFFKDCPSRLRKAADYLEGKC